MHSRGYTGQKSSAFRNFQFSAKNVQELIEVVQKLEKTDFTSLPPVEFTQFVRGKLFVLVDSLMTSYKPRKENAFLKTDLDIIMELCQACIKLICKWFNMLPQNLSNVFSLAIYHLLVFTSCPYTQYFSCLNSSCSFSSAPRAC